MSVKEKKIYVYDGIMTRHLTSQILQKVEEAKMRLSKKDNPSAAIKLDLSELNFLISILE